MSQRKKIEIEEERTWTSELEISDDTDYDMLVMTTQDIKLIYFFK